MSILISRPGTLVPEYRASTIPPEPEYLKELIGEHYTGACIVYNGKVAQFIYSGYNDGLDRNDWASSVVIENGLQGIYIYGTVVIITDESCFVVPLI